MPDLMVSSKGTRGQPEWGIIIVFIEGCQRGTKNTSYWHCFNLTLMYTFRKVIEFEHYWVLYSLISLFFILAYSILSSTSLESRTTRTAWVGLISQKHLIFHWFTWFSHINRKVKLIYQVNAIKQLIADINLISVWLPISKLLQFSHILNFSLK